MFAAFPRSSPRLASTPISICADTEQVMGVKTRAGWGHPERLGAKGASPSPGGPTGCRDTPAQLAHHPSRPCPLPQNLRGGQAPLPCRLVYFKSCIFRLSTFARFLYSKITALPMAAAAQPGLLASDLGGCSLAVCGLGFDKEESRGAQHRGWLRARRSRGKTGRKSLPLLVLTTKDRWRTSTL